MQQTANLHIGYVDYRSEYVLIECDTEEYALNRAESMAKKFKGVRVIRDGAVIWPIEKEEEPVAA